MKRDYEQSKTKHPGVYRRDFKTGKTNYIIAYRDERGKLRQETYPTLAIAVKAKRNKLSKLDEGIAVAPNKQTFGDVYEQWQAEELPKLRPNTQVTYRASIERYVLSTFENIPVTKIDPPMIVAWMDTLQGKGLKTWTIRAAESPLKGVLDLAVWKRLIPTNPAKGLPQNKRPKADQSKTRVPTQEELASLFAHAHPRFLLALQIAAYTGVRASELLGLVWADTDLGLGFVNVSGQLERGERVERTKTGAGRSVPLMPALVKALSTHKLVSAYSKAGDPIFAMDDGSHMTYPSLEQGMKSAAKKAGLRDEKGNVRLHSLRHFYCSSLCDQGHDDAYVMEKMGHGAESMLSLYRHAVNVASKDDQARQTMETAFGASI